MYLFAFLFRHTEIAYIRHKAAKGGSVPPFVLIHPVHSMRLVQDRRFNGTKRCEVAKFDHQFIVLCDQA